MEGDRADRATIAIWELEVWWRAQLEGDTAATAICELVVFGWQTKATATTAIWEPEFWVAGPVGKWATTAIWVLAVFFGPSSTAMSDLSFLGGGHLRIPGNGLVHLAVRPANVCGAAEMEWHVSLV